MRTCFDVIYDSTSAHASRFAQTPVPSIMEMYGISDAGIYMRLRPILRDLDDYTLQELRELYTLPDSDWDIIENAIKKLEQRRRR